MMGSRHGASGVFGAALSLPLAVSWGVNPAVWTAAWVGAALLPDMDSGGSHAARVWGWPTRALGSVLGKVAGGHRESTHDIVVAPLAAAAITGAAAGVALFAGASWAAGWRAGLVLILGLLFGICGRVILAKKWRQLRPLRHPLVNAPVALGAAWWVTGGGPTWWLPLVVAAGIVLHVLCDSVTIEGAPLPLAWIWDKQARSVQWGLRWFRTGPSGVDFKKVRAAAREARRGHWNPIGRAWAGAAAAARTLRKQLEHPSDAIFAPIFYGGAAVAVVYWSITLGWLPAIPWTAS